MGCLPRVVDRRSKGTRTAAADGGIGQIAYPLVADVTKDIARSYGTLLDPGMALRGTFLIDRQGVVRSAVLNDLPLGRNIDETIRTLDALQYSEEHGEVCPAGWNRGKAAMKETPDAVKKYLAEKASKL